MIKYSYLIPIDGTLTGTSTPDQNELKSNGNEGVLHIPPSSRTGVSPADVLVLYLGHSLTEGGLPLGRNAIGVFYSLSRLGC